jgi:nucleotide-binding universal stress UspA family protein
MAEIVVGYDGSDTADLAVDKALNLARAQDSVTVVTAFHMVGEEFGAPISEETRRIVFKSAEQTLERAMDRVKNGSPKASFEIAEGKPAESLAKVADERDADLIVVGSRGLDPARAALGSQTLRLLARATCPVVVVPPGATSS